MEIPLPDGRGLRLRDSSIRGLVLEILFDANSDEDYDSQADHCRPYQRPQCESKQTYYPEYKESYYGHQKCNGFLQDPHDEARLTKETGCSLGPDSSNRLFDIFREVRFVGSFFRILNNAGILNIIVADITKAMSDSRLGN